MTSLYGSNAPVFKSPDPLPPVGAVFYFRVAGDADAQSVYSSPNVAAEKVGTHCKGEVVRVTDFDGPWVRLACETEAQITENWQGWMVSEDEKSTFLEEVEDPLDNEKEYTKSLFKRIWKVADHVAGRLKDRTTARAAQYLETGRVPPGKKELLPDGTRCMNAFWGLEARWIRLPPGTEYWPQGCLSLPPGYVRSGWEQPLEESRQGHWRIFAARPFGAYELVEVCPLVEVDAELCISSMQLRMNLVETPVDDDGGLVGRVKSFVPLGYGMLYQQSIELDDVKINWTPVTNFNCKFIAAKGHMYIYATRKIQAGEELILEFKRAFRTDQGEAIDFTGFTPYWCRQAPPDAFRTALTAPCGPRKVRPVPGCVKFGKSQLHERGIFADAAYKKGELAEMCPCLVLDMNGAFCMQDYSFQLPEVALELEGRRIVKRQARHVLPCGYGGMYNHLETDKGENVEWLYDETTQCCVFVVDPRDGEEVPRNAELCFDYGESYWDAPQRRCQRPGRRERGSASREDMVRVV